MEYDVVEIIGWDEMGFFVGVCLAMVWILDRWAARQGSKRE